MSARRQARHRDPAMVTREAGGVPAVLAIGRCMEVWSEEADRFTEWSAMRRFGAVRSWWLETSGIEDRESWHVIPDGAPWSVEYLSYPGQANRIGKPGSQIVAERLAAAGCDIADVDHLRAEASRLYKQATRTSSHSERISR